MYRITPQIVWRREDVERLVDEYRQVDAFAIDTETVGTRPPVQLTAKKKDKPALDWKSNRVFWISLATYGRSDVIACGHPTGPGPGVDEQLTPFEVVEILKPLLLSDQLKIGHNLKFDFLTMKKYLGVVPSGPYADTQVMAHLINENLPNYRLKELIKVLFKFEYENLGAKKPEDFPFWETGRYARFDALFTWLMYWNFEPKIRAQKVERAWALEMDVLEALFRMEEHGAVIDRDQIDALDTDLRQQLRALEERITSVAKKHPDPPPSYFTAKRDWEAKKVNAGQEYQPWDGTFSMSYHLDRGWFVYEVRKNKPTVFTEKTNKPSTAEVALKPYAKRDKEVAALMEWDDLHKLHATYVHAMRVRLTEENRLHANFKQSGTKTGRFSCDDPNLQNVPRAGTPIGKKIRGMFIAPPGHVMVVGDFNQIELRVLGHRAKEPTLIRVFKEGQDPHRVTATMIMSLLGLNPEEMTDEQRTNFGKTPNFAIVYGAGPAKLMEGTGLSARGAREVLEALWASYPRVKSWSQYVVRECKERKYVRTLTGRKRRLPEINWGGTDEAEKRRGYAERQAVNTCIQGDAADINKMAIVRFHAMTKDTPHRLILSVHDELVAYTPVELVDECKALMREAMVGEEMQQLLSVPLEADINSGDRWSEAK